MNKRGVGGTRGGSTRGTSQVQKSRGSIRGTSQFRGRGRGGGTVTRVTPRIRVGNARETQRTTVSPTRKFAPNLPKFGNTGKSSSPCGPRGSGTDELVTVIPPLYPPAGIPLLMKPGITSLVSKLLVFDRYFRSNYEIKDPVKASSAFVIPRYSDRYASETTFDPSLAHSIAPSIMPAEIASKSTKPSSRKKYMTDQEADKKLDALSLMDEIKAAPPGNEGDEESDEPPIKKIKREADVSSIKVDEQSSEGEEEDEPDEELDEGTDYMANYFDNGEGYLDSDDDNLDDGAVY